MSDEVEQRLVEVLDEHSTSPFGNPIPGLASLQGESATAEAADAAAISESQTVAEDPTSVRAADLTQDAEHDAVIASFNEIVQVEGSLMKRLGAAGIRPGSQVTIIPADDKLTLRAETGEVTIPSDLAHAIRVRTLS